MAAHLHVAAATGPHPPFLWELNVLPKETAGIHLARVGLYLCGMRSGLHPPLSHRALHWGRSWVGVPRDECTPLRESSGGLLQPQAASRSPDSAPR